MAAIFEIFLKSGHSIFFRYPGGWQFHEINLSVTVAKIQNGRLFENLVKSGLCIFVRYPVGQKFCRNRSISHGKGNSIRFPFWTIPNRESMAQSGYFMIFCIQTMKWMNLKTERDLSCIGSITVEFFQNHGTNSISVILLTNGRKDGRKNGRKDGQTDKLSQI